MSKPYISVIVSVYNGEATISRCLESLVYQSLDNIEIIVVDKASKDTSLEIAKKYEKNFPHKVKVYERPYSINMAAGLTFGISVAQADYLAFCDVDDWYELNAMETLWNELQQEPVDVLTYAWRFLRENGSTIRVGKHSEEGTLEAQLLSSQMFTYWCRLWKRTLFLPHLPIPEVGGCDAYFLPVVLQDADSIRCINNVLYNYVAGVGTTNQRVSPEWLTIIDGWNYLLANIRKEHIALICAFIARRVIGGAKKFWLYRIEYVQWLKEHQQLFLENPFIKPDQKLYKEIVQLIQEEKEYIPLNIYIHGFGKSETEIQEKVDCLRQLPLSAGTGTIYILNESTVDVQRAPHLKAALEDGRYDYVGHYCALERIWETGGIFVGDHLIFRATFEPVLENKSFFSFITIDTFSEQIWGAQAHNPVIHALLETYQTPNFYPDPYLPLADRIRNILVALYEIPLNGRPARREDVFVYDARVMVLNRMEGVFVCEHDMSDCWKEENYTVIPDDVALPTTVGSMAEVRKLKQELVRYQRELQEIYASDSWKLIKRMKRFANSSLGKPFKYVFKWMVRKYRRYKYGM